MNQNSYDQQIDLKQAVEQQLDLILKMQEDRKALKKQNRVLTLKLKSFNQIISKYQKDTSDQSSNTDFIEENKSGGRQPEKVSVCEQEIQVEIENKDGNSQILTILNNSKLTQAQQYLKVLQAKKQEEQEAIQTVIKVTQKDKQQKKNLQRTKGQNAGSNNTKQLSQEIMKMSKQISSLKRELKESDHRNSQKEKQIRQVRKCLETKGEALQKSRKQFNELSNLYNTDKYKSIKNLEAQMKTIKTKLTAKQQELKTFHKLKDVKGILEDLTKEYQEYKQEMQSKVDILIGQIAEKQKKNQELVGEQKKLLKKLEFNAQSA